MSRTRAVFTFAVEGWRQLSPTAKVAAVLFEAAFLVKVGLLVYLVAS